MTETQKAIVEKALGLLLVDTAKWMAKEENPNRIVQGSEIINEIDELTCAIKEDKIGFL